MKTLRRILIGLLCGAVLAAAGCGKPEPPDAAPEGTTAQAEPTTADTAQYNAYKEISVALLYSGATAGAPALVGAQSRAADQSVSEDAFRLIHAEKRSAPVSENFATLRRPADEAIKSGATVLIGADRRYDGLFFELAAEYPDVIFLCYGGYRAQGGNFFEYAAKLYEAFYLAGVAAATRSESGRLAFIADAASSAPEICANASGFLLGARAVNPDARVFVMTADDSKDEADCLRELALFGCDVAAGSFSEDEVYAAAEDAQIRVIGFGEKGKTYAQRSVVAGIFVDFSSCFTCVYRAIAENETASLSNFFVGAADDAVGLEFAAQNADADAEKMVQEAASLLRSGGFDVFSGQRLVFSRESLSFHMENAPLTDNAGNEIIPAGGYALEETVLNGYMNFYVNGIYIR